MPRRGRVARWAGFGASLAALANGCSERERPGRIGDTQGEDAERAVSGSFRAPRPGVAASTRDGGLSAAPADAGGGGVTEPGSVTLQQTYEARCDDSTVQWGFFTYEAATPSDSSIRFRVRTAVAEAELASSRQLDVLTASAALGTQRCGYAGPAPCPIDLYELLGGAPRAHHPFAQVEVLLSASADAIMPVVEAWQLTYSCTFNQ